MKMRLWFGAAVVGAGLSLAPATVQAQVNDIGKREYTNSCAVCHGASGKGDGPLASQLKTP